MVKQRRRLPEGIHIPPVIFIYMTAIGLNGFSDLPCPLRNFYNHPVMPRFSFLSAIMLRSLLREICVIMLRPDRISSVFMPPTHNNCYYVAFRKWHGSDTLPTYNPYVSRHKNAKKDSRFFPLSDLDDYRGLLALLKIRFPSFTSTVKRWAGLDCFFRL